MKTAFKTLGLALAAGASSLLVGGQAQAASLSLTFEGSWRDNGTVWIGKGATINDGNITPSTSQGVASATDNTDRLDPDNAFKADGNFFELAQGGSVIFSADRKFSGGNTIEITWGNRAKWPEAIEVYAGDATAFASWPGSLNTSSWTEANPLTITNSDVSSSFSFNPSAGPYLLFVDKSTDSKNTGLATAVAYGIDDVPTGFDIDSVVVDVPEPVSTLSFLGMGVLGLVTLAGRKSSLAK